ncbi:hypothetical protein AKUH3B103M_PHAGE100200 (plasmid) [Apilactobacillus kunkeei]|nr:hypothetical protein AKUH3B103M_PHAGE100200 [Apilactobacillus kunkeei]
MKTLNDLVDKLNNYVEDGELGKYYIEQGGDKRYYLYEQYFAPDDGLLVVFAPDYPHWIIHCDFGMVNYADQEKIMDFIYNTDKEHWFDEPEKKYNIIIGEGEQGKLKTAYKKFSNGTYIGDAVEEDDLKKDRYIFTESEIEDLKATLPENMAKIVELGKVEVKDERYY